MDTERFIQGMARLLANWGMPLTAARIYGYLLLQPRPVALDQIAADMGISKASAWGAARHLEQVGQIERFRQPGSKRALFAATQDVARSLLRYSGLLGKLSVLLGDGAEVVAQADVADRLRGRSAFYGAVHQSIEAAIRAPQAAPLVAGQP